MESLQKVLWEEGMLLTPQHFQLAEGYVEDNLVSRFQALVPYAWGVCKLAIDLESLKNDTFHLFEFQGIFRDGTIVRAPAYDNLPVSRNLTGKELSPSEPLGIFLALPLESREHQNCSENNGQQATRQTRFFRDTVTVNDFNAGGKREEIPIGRKNLRIVFSDEKSDGMTTIQIAKIVRTPAGNLTIQEVFIPPLLWLQASPHLMQLVHTLKERMTALCQEYSDQRHGMQGQEGIDLVQVSLLQALFGCIPQLAHILSRPNVHPEKLYEVLIGFSGTLGLLDPKFQPHDLPPYDHENLSDTFQALEMKLRQIISRTTPERYVTIPFNRSNDCWEVKVEDEAFWEKGQFFVVAMTDMGEEEAVSQIMNQMKVAWPETIQIMISQAMSGVEFHHVLRPPAGVPLRSGHYYFHLKTNSSFWEEVCRVQSLSVYLPHQSEPVRLELLVIKE